MSESEIGVLAFASIKSTYINQLTDQQYYAGVCILFRCYVALSTPDTKHVAVPCIYLHLNQIFLAKVIALPLTFIVLMLETSPHKQIHKLLI